MYQLEEFPDVFADACLRDAEGRMLLLSLYGRDTALNQFVAAISLPASQLGVGAFHLVGVDGRRHFCDVGGADRLAKHSGRLPRQNLFGPLSHLWIYDKALQAPDLVNRIGWVLLRGEGSQADLQLELLGWRLMQRLSPVALLDTWREALIEWPAAPACCESSTNRGSRRSVLSEACGSAWARPWGRAEIRSNLILKPFSYEGSSL